MQWLEKHSKALQAFAGIMTMILALLALIGVKMQIDASFDSQREQSARDVYREFLSVSVNNPDFAQPDYCAITQGPKRNSYEAYVDYLFYAAEQSLEMDPELQSVFASHLEPHAAYLCSDQSPNNYSGSTKILLDKFMSSHCKAETTC